MISLHSRAGIPVAFPTATMALMPLAPAAAKEACETCRYDGQLYTVGAVRQTPRGQVQTCKTAKDQSDLNWRN